MTATGANGGAVLNTSHLHSLQARLVDARTRLRASRTLGEARIRDVWVAQLESEICREYQFLGIQPDQPPDYMSDEELLAALSEPQS